MIYEENGYYGFTPKTCDFVNINNLVEYYSTNSLHGLNHKLDIKLIHPVNKEPSAAGQQNIESVNYLQMNQN